MSDHLFRRFVRQTMDHQVAKGTEQATLPEAYEQNTQENNAFKTSKERDIKHKTQEAFPRVML